MLIFTTKTLALKRVPRMDPARVGQIQRRRLGELVRTAIGRASFYREKYRGIDPDRFRLADLPPTNKGELMAHFDRAVTDPDVRRAELEKFIDDPANEGKPFLGKYAVSHTSGSQGQPMLMVQERNLLELLFGMQMTRGHAGKTTAWEAAKAAFVPVRLAVVTLKNGFYPSASSFDYMPRPARHYVDVLRLSQTDPDVVDRLNAFRPMILTAYAGVLEMLALEAEAGRLQLAPELRQVTNNSEVLTDRARIRVEAAFGHRVLNNYATGECPFLSNGCPTDFGAHINADWAILEVVDDAYQPVPDGQAGTKVLLTNLANRAQPIIRYEVGDVVTMATEPCRCGSKLPRVASIDGRSADTFHIRDGSGYRQVINSVFKNAFDYTREVREWQAVQSERNKVVIKLELLPGATFDAPRARAALDRQLAMYDYLGVLDVTLEVVPRLAADPGTGKFRRMISLVGPPNDRRDTAEPAIPGPHAPEAAARPMIPQPQS